MTAKQRHDELAASKKAARDHKTRSQKVRAARDTVPTKATKSKG